METPAEKVELQQVRGEERVKRHDLVVREYPLTILLNGEELVTLLCTPQDLEELAVGYLLSEAFIWSPSDLKSFSLRDGVARVEIEGWEATARRGSPSLRGTGCGGEAHYWTQLEGARHWRISSKLTISRRAVLNLMGEFQRHSVLFRATGGVHAAALADGEQILLFKEDIGRHNAVDKVLGECLLQGVPTDDKLLLLSGRLSSEIVLKVARREVPLLISRAAPTDKGVWLAQEVGMTLVGFVRGKRMNVYTHDWRIT